MIESKPSIFQNRPVRRDQMRIAFVLPYKSTVMCWASISAGCPASEGCHLQRKSCRVNYRCLVAGKSC
jgi:hypothetical protein